MVSYIGTRLHQPSSTGSSLLRLTGLTLIFTTSHGHSNPGWGINAKSCRNVHLSKFGIKVPLKWYIRQGSLCQQRSTKPCTHTHTHRRSSYHCLVLYVFIPRVEAPASETDLCQRVQVVAAWLFACHATLFISQSTWRF